MSHTEGALLTAQQVALLLAVKPSWVYASARAGDLPHYLVGKHVRFDEAEIRTWLRAQRRSSDNCELQRSEDNRREKTL